MKMKDYKNIIDQKLSDYVEIKNCLESNLIDSMRYSLLCGGKRIRPIILLEFCRICGGNVEKVIPFACALEMVHTYSLIHDDLPCMDNDDMRRGKPANHIVYGENIALLAGDALLTLAFEVMLSSKSEKKADAAKILAKNIGVFGMIGGQVIDLESENKKIDINILKEMDQKKTGKLICAAAEMGCVLAGASEEKVLLAKKYAEYLGIAFQIVDDILDVISNSDDLGKPSGSDKEKNKSTYVSCLGLSKAKLESEKFTNKAIEILDEFNCDTNDLKILTKRLCLRNF